MARLVITRHSRLDGEYPLVTKRTMKLATQAEVEHASGIPAKEYVKYAQEASFSTMVMVFASLWQAGMRPTWDEVSDLTADQWTFARDAGDPSPEGEDEAETDPPQAPEASAQDDAEPEPDESPTSPQ